MTDEQFKQFMTVQVAQLGALQGIESCLQAIGVAQGKAGGHHWGKVSEYLANAKAILDKQAQ